jgi:ribonuclease BN (tRNA processing enzyme)
LRSRRVLIKAGGFVLLLGTAVLVRAGQVQQTEPPKPPAQTAQDQEPFPIIKPERREAYRIHPRLAKRTRLVLLGTGTPIPQPESFGPGTVIVVDEKPYLVDFGVGVVRQTQAIQKAGVLGLTITRLCLGFCTHLHSDHTLGLADLITTPWMAGRSEPLVLFGPDGLSEMVEHILKAYEKSNQHTLTLPVSPNPRGLKVDVRPMRPGVIYKDERVTVRAFPVNHGSWPDAYGLRFDTPDLKVVCSGDTAPSQRLIEEARGCDVLIHEAYCEKNFAFLDPATRSYYKAFHTSSSELAKIAEEVKPRLLILVHEMHFASGPSDMLKEIRKGYKGKVLYGRDLDIF